MNATDPGVDLHFRVIEFGSVNKGVGDRGRAAQGITGVPRSGYLFGAPDGFAGRGAERRVTMPYDEPSAQCIGCGACAEVCPTGNILVHDSEGQREIAPFGMKLSLVPCHDCGQGYVTGRQLDLLKEQLGARSAVTVGCPVCRRRQRARELSKAYEAVAPR